MKKKLEAELMSLAHNVLKLRNKSDLHILLNETKKLQEKLAVLVFLEDNSSEIKPTFSIQEAQNKVIEIFDQLKVDKGQGTVIEKNTQDTEQENATEALEEVREEAQIIVNKVPEITITEDVIIPEPIIIEPEPIIEEPILKIEEPKIEIKKVESKATTPIEPVIEETPPAVDFDFSIPKKEITPSSQTTIDDFLGTTNPTPTFVKAQEETPKQVSINDKMKKGFTIGLNDKIAFVKHLFDSNNADFIRVISQINTLDNYEDAKFFVQTMVKPDHNDWTGKEEVEERFMHILENKFS